MEIKIQFFNPEANDMAELELRFQSTKELREKLSQAGIKSIALCQSGKSYPEEREYQSTENLLLEKMQNARTYLCRAEDSEHLLRVISSWPENREV
jgi:hypothetical protein